MFFDTHCHITTEGNEAYLTYIQEAKSQHVTHLLNINCHPEEFEQSLNIPISHILPDVHVYSSIGVHPTYYKDEHMDTSILRAFLSTLEQQLRSTYSTWEKHIIAIGECGLDYYWPHNKDAQHCLFELHVALAQQWDLPLIIHTRDAWDDMLTFLKKYPALRAVIHCFSGDLEILDQLLRFPNLMISFAGTVTFPKAQEQFAPCIKAIPDDRFLIETDSPYLAPVPFRGKANQPAYVAHTAAHIAALRGVSIEHIGHTTMHNACRFFNIPTASK